MKKILLSVVAISAMSLIFWACQKPRPLQPGQGTFQKMSLTVPMTCTAPNTVNGRLAFATYADYECWEEWLSKVVLSLDTTVNDDDILDSIELSLGHQSLRAMALQTFEAQNAIGWDMLTIPEEHWVGSRYTRSVLNQDREFQVASHVYKYITPEYIGYYPVGATSVATALQGLAENATIEEILDIDDGSQFLSVSSVLHPDKVFGSQEFADGVGKHNTPIPMGGPEGDFVVAGTITNSLACVNTGYTTFTGFRLAKTDGFLYQRQKAQFTWDFDDGSAPVTYTSTLGAQQDILAEILINYFPGWHYPTLTVKSISPYSSGSTVVFTHTYAVYVHSMNETCTDQARGAAAVKDIDADHKMLCKADYYQWWNFGAPLGYSTSFKGFTELYKRTGPNAFTRVKNKALELCVRIDADLANTDCTPSIDFSVSQCGTNTYRKEYEQRYTGKRFMRSMKTSHHANWGSVNGFHELNIDICQ